MPSTLSETAVIDIYADACILPFQEACFDTVLCTQVLEHVREPQRLINEAFRVLRPGGTLLLSAPQTWGLHEQPADFWRFTRYGLEYLLTKSGFRVVSTAATSGMWGMVGQRTASLIWGIIGHNRTVPVKAIAAMFVAIWQLMACVLDHVFGHRGDTLDWVALARKPKHKHLPASGDVWLD